MKDWNTINFLKSGILRKESTLLQQRNKNIVSLFPLHKHKINPFSLNHNYLYGMEQHPQKQIIF